MMLLRYIFASLLIIVLQTDGIHGQQCVWKQLFDKKGEISHSYTVSGSAVVTACWKINNPSKLNLTVEVQHWDFLSKPCDVGYMHVKDTKSGETHKFCTGSPKNKTIVSFSDIEVYYYVYSNKFPNDVRPNFRLNYKIDIDERGTREKVIGWLLEKRESSWGWKENNPKALIALYLTQAKTFDGSDCDEELMVKQGELSVSVALLKNPISDVDLSTLIHSMLVACHSPRRFFGQDLVMRLYNQVEKSSDDYIHPMSYLALCNANVSWPERATTDLTKVLKSESDYPFVRDIQSFALLAISCLKSRQATIDGKAGLLSLQDSVARKFMKNQDSDGSFGNVHTTALITQALIASGFKNSGEWKKLLAMKFLTQKVLSPSVDLLAAYLTLPLLKERTLADIASVNCTGNPRNKADLVSEIHDYTGPKIKVHYSLYIGDKKDIVHTVMLRVPENYTAFLVMQFAQAQDPKFKFEYERRSGKVYVYDISRIPNDPESGKFWLLYLGDDTEKDLTHHLTSPDEVVLNDEERLIMWYKTARIV